MRPSENIEKLINKLQVEPRADASKRNLEDTLAVHKETINSAYSKPNIWRNFMKNRITKYAAAATIIIAAIIILNQIGTPIDGASSAFAQVLENTNKMPWICLKCTSSRFDDPNESSSTIWFNVSAKIHAMVTDDKSHGEYRDYTNMIRYDYESKNNILLINGMANQPYKLWSNINETNSDFLKTQFLSVDPNNSKIEKNTVQYQGETVDVYTININKENSNRTIDIFVDQKTNLIIFIKSIELMNSSDKLLLEMTTIFSYPDDGPKDIYELVGNIPETVRVLDGISGTKPLKIKQE